MLFVEDEMREAYVCTVPAHELTEVICTCSLTIPRDPSEMLPNAEALQAIGLCPWCGYPEEDAVLAWNNPDHIIYRCEC